MTAEQKANIVEAIEEMKVKVDENLQNLSPRAYNVDEINRESIQILNKMKDSLDTEDWDTFDNEIEEFESLWYEIYSDGDFGVNDQMDTIDENRPEWVDDDE